LLLLWNLLYTLDKLHPYFCSILKTTLWVSIGQKESKSWSNLPCNIVLIFPHFVERVRANFENNDKNSLFPYLKWFYRIWCGWSIFCWSDIYFLGYNVMGNPFWGRAKGPYWIPFFVPSTDHLHIIMQTKLRNKLLKFRIYQKPNLVHFRSRFSLTKLQLHRDFSNL